MHRVCAWMPINVCLWRLEHITVGKPNLPAIVLIKAMFLRLSPDGRQHQLHKTTGTRRGRLPQPHWHPLWTSPDFKRYSLSDYRVTDLEEKKKEGNEKVYPSNHLYPNTDILMPLKHAQLPENLQIQDDNNEVGVLWKTIKKPLCWTTDVV